jgi:hypothetical protein
MKIPMPTTTRRRFATLALLLAASAPALAQQPPQQAAFTLPQLKALAALSPDAFRQEVRRLGFSYVDRTATEEVSMIEYDRFADGQTARLMKSTYAGHREAENSVELSLTDKAAFDRLVKEVRDAGFVPAEKGRIPGGETYQDYKRSSEVVRFVHPAKRTGSSPPSYTAVVWR